MYDLIIIGGGPAAISAGIYAARKKLKTILFAKNWGGQLADTSAIENYLGFESINGPDLVNKFVNHLKTYQLEIKQGIEVKKIKVESDLLIRVKTKDGSYQSKTLLLALGRQPKKLGLANEDKFIGRGISYCSICDAPLFKNKEVAIIGSGNAGLEAALDLTKYALKIYLIESASDINGDGLLREKVLADPKVATLKNVLIKEIKGEQFVSSLVYQDKNSGKVKEISIQGIFVTIGSKANSFLVRDVVELNESGEIKINSRNQTSQPNIFAAGDVTDVSHKQVIIAAGEGAKAVLNAYDYLRNHS